MQLFRMKVKKEGVVYVDYLLAWKYGDKVRTHRVLPVFATNYRAMFKRAINIEDVKQINDYDLGE